VDFFLSTEEILHCLFVATLLAIGTTCLVWAYLLLPRLDRKKNHTRFISAKDSKGLWIKFACATLLLLAGILLLSYLGHSELTHHKSSLSLFFHSGSNGDSALVLGVLAVVMTLVTAGVVTISRHSLDDIRREKEGLQDSYEEVKKLELWHRVTTLRLELLYENQQELDLYSLSGEDLPEEEEVIKLFRESLQAHYAKWNKIPVYVRDLHGRYSPNMHGKLLTIEYDYLQEIQRYYQIFPEKQPQDQDIPSQIDDILRR